MNSRSFIIAPIRFPIYLFILSYLLFFQSPQPVQSISLSRLCGQFGHSCFGANWGKRSASYETTPRDMLSDLVIDNNNPTTVSSIVKDNLINEYLLEEFRLKLLRRRIRQLFGLE
ncbi:unnamed protein product [Adineta steineri]|uniref:Uncharacterized protein n=1 Tax=Adineta steineri TaxID=433720 RepID=A0A815NWP5_9BILA|nr:unnamed protein product [Adineta steineri]